MEITQIWKDILFGIVAALLLALAIAFAVLLYDGDFPDWPTTMLPFDLKDRTISYPVLPNTIGGVTVVIVNTVVTVALAIVWLCCHKHKYGSNKALFFLIVYMVLMGGALVNLLTLLIKPYRGGLRPHFIAACKPNKTIVDSLVGSWVNLTVTKKICTAKGKPDYRWSFPSGHSSEAFFGCVLSILIIQHIKYKDINIGKQWGSFWQTIKVSLLFVLISFSSWVAVSRIVDYHHQWWDVLAGSLLGTVFAAVLFYWFLEPVMQQIAGILPDDAENSGMEKQDV